MSIDPKEFFKANGKHWIKTKPQPGWGFTVEELYQAFEARFKAENKPTVPVVKVIPAENHYEKWYNENEERLSIEAAESGADREHGFDFDEFCEDRFDEFLKGNIK